MKNKVYISRGYCPDDCSIPYWVYQKTVASQFGFSLYEIIFTFQRKGELDVDKFKTDLKALPKNCVLYINHESGDCWPWFSGDIRQPNDPGIKSQLLCQQLVRANRPDIIFGSFNVAPRKEYVWNADWKRIIRQSNEVVRLIGNGAHFLLPCFYQDMTKDSDFETYSFTECIRAARETWPLVTIIPTITVQDNYRICEKCWPALQQPTFRFTKEQLDYCRIKPERTQSLLQVFSAMGIDKVLVWSQGYVPVSVIKDNLEVLKEWIN